MTLTASVGNQTRAATGRVTVVEPAKAPPPPPVHEQTPSENPPVTFDIFGSGTPDGHGDVVVGTVHCLLPTGHCSTPLYLLTTQGQLQPGAVRAAAIQRFPLVVLARVRVKVKAGKTAKIMFHVGPKVRRKVRSGGQVKSLISTRPVGCRPEQPSDLAAAAHPPARRATDAARLQRGAGAVSGAGQGLHAGGTTTGRAGAEFYRALNLRTRFSPLASK